MTEQGPSRTDSSASPPAWRPARGRAWPDLVLIVAAIFAVAGIAFALGRLTAPKTSAVTGLRGGQLSGGQLPAGSPFPGGGLFGSGGIALRGQVIEASADHLTLKLQSGQTVQIGLSSATAYHRQAQAASADVTPGSEVVVQLERGAGRGAGTQPSPGAGNLTLGGAIDVTVVGP